MSTRSSTIFGDSTLTAKSLLNQQQNETLPNANVQELELAGVIGFNGHVPHGILLHPNDQHLIYPLGSTIVVRDLVHNTQTFLHKGGHDRAVSCLALSATGKYLASGQVTHMGFGALVRNNHTILSGAKVTGMQFTQLCSFFDLQCPPLLLLGLDLESRDF